jgi:branched-subunit amino acid aminotransferase/4-amino-4-deoxychorismate lyase
MILVDGIPADSLPITDSTILRGDGCFEAMRCYRGSLFALDEHIERLERSAAALEIEPPDSKLLTEWCETVAADLQEGVVRVVVSQGDAVPGADGRSRCVVLGHALPPSPSELALAVVEAPWHAAGRRWELAGAKTVSYAPNMSAGRTAHRRGADDALLVAPGGTVLEGPTFAVGWVVEGRLETPSLDLLILDSITRRHVLALAREAGIEVVEGSFSVDRLDQAEEVMAWSTVKEVTAVRSIGRQRYPEGPMTVRLAEIFTTHVESVLELR